MSNALTKYSARLTLNSIQLDELAERWRARADRAFGLGMAGIVIGGAVALGAYLYGKENYVPLVAGVVTAGAAFGLATPKVVSAAGQTADYRSAAGRAASREFVRAQCAAKREFISSSGPAPSKLYGDFYANVPGGPGF